MHQAQEAPRNPTSPRIFSCDFPASCTRTLLLPPMRNVFPDGSQGPPTYRTIWEETFTARTNGSNLDATVCPICGSQVQVPAVSSVPSPYCRTCIVKWYDLLQVWRTREGEACSDTAASRVVPPPGSMLSPLPVPTRALASLHDVSLATEAYKRYIPAQTWWVQERREVHEMVDLVAELHRLKALVQHQGELLHVADMEVQKLRQHDSDVHHLFSELILEKASESVGATLEKADLEDLKADLARLQTSSPIATGALAELSRQALSLADHVPMEAPVAPSRTRCEGAETNEAHLAPNPHRLSLIVENGDCRQLLEKADGKEHLEKDTKRILGDHSSNSFRLDFYKRWWRRSSAHKPLPTKQFLPDSSIEVVS